MQKVIMSIVGLVIGIMLVANLLPDVVDEAATDAFEQSFTGVTTGVGVTQATVTLGYDHYYGDERNITISSTNTNDTPVVVSYTEATRALVVGDLEASSSRTLTVDYYREANLQYTGFSAFLRLIPFLAIIGLVIAALWGLFGHMKRE
jgi:hypothetical protein